MITINCNLRLFAGDFGPAPGLEDGTRGLFLALSIFRCRLTGMSGLYRILTQRRKGATKSSTAFVAPLRRCVRNLYPFRYATRRRYSETKHACRGS